MKNLGDAGTGLKQAEWSATSGGGYGILKLHFGADIVRFADLEPSSFQKLKEHLKECFKVQLEEQKPSSAGWSWGELELNGEKSLRLMSGLDNDRAVALEVDMAEVNQVACAGKNELSLELQNRPDEMLQCIRFFVPSGEGGGSAESWRDELSRLAKTSDGQVLAHLQEVTIVAPRGKHDLFFNAKSLQIRGKSQSYMMKWESVKKLFQLDLPGNQKLVVIGLSTPIRYGKMLYNLVGLTFDSSTT
ncbi:ssrp1, partial [Symbiodinium sp. KB8]